MLGKQKLAGTFSFQDRGKPALQHFDTRQGSDGDRILRFTHPSHDARMAADMQRKRVGVEQDHAPSPVSGRPRLR